MAGEPTLQFLGAAGTVTGSKYLVKYRGQQVMLDCGMFQGVKELRIRNWTKPDFSAREIMSVVLSHAHIDHTGYLPVLVRQGFRGRIHCTRATADLLDVLLPDSAKLQEEDSERANRRGYSRHQPALPLFSMDDVKTTLKLIETHPFHKTFDVGSGLKVEYRRTGHILGSASVDLAIGKTDPVRLVFSGDLGRWDRPILLDPEDVPEADILLVEGTYGDRIHPPDPMDELARLINDSANQGGAMIIPAFAVDRTQEIIYCLRKLEDERRIPVLPVFVDSPMAIEVHETYCRHHGEHDPEMAALQGADSCLQTQRQVMVRHRDESKAINALDEPLIIISSAGMATGGRVLHHLAKRLPDPRTTVLLAGFQAEGTRGRQLEQGAESIVIHGREVPVRASVRKIEGLSAHADQSEILRWLHGFQRPPAMCYIVHAEPGPAAELKRKIEEDLDWAVTIAVDGAVVPIHHNREYPGTLPT